MKSGLQEIWRNVKKLFNRLDQERVIEASGAITYFSFFSMFPLLLITISIGSIFFSEQQMYNAVVGFIESFSPGLSKQLISENLSQVLEHRSQAGFVSLVMLLWTGTGSLSALTRNMSRAWKQTRPRNLWRVRLFAAGEVAGFLLLMILFSVLQVVLNVLEDTAASIPGMGFISVVLTSAVLPLFVFLAFWLLYRLVPHADVSWRSSAYGAAIATIGTQAFTTGFGWYLRVGINRYNLIYGSLGTVTAFLFWLYIVVLFVLVGAHVSAVVGDSDQNKNNDL